MAKNRPKRKRIRKSEWDEPSDAEFRQHLRSHSGGRRSRSRKTHGMKKNAKRKTSSKAKMARGSKSLAAWVRAQLGGKSNPARHRVTRASKGWAQGPSGTKVRILRRKGRVIVQVKK